MISIVILLLGGATPAFSQTEKSNFLIGGNMSLGHSSTDNSTSSGFSISPNISYFVINNLAAGAMISSSYSQSTTTVGSIKFDSNSSSIGAGPTVRYYFPVSEKIYLFPELDMVFAKSTARNTPDGSPTVESTNTQSIFRVGVGGTYFIAKNVGLEGFAYYQNLNSSASSTSTTTSSINLRIGLQVYILRKLN